MDAKAKLPDDLNPEIVKATAIFIGKITGMVPPPHDAFPPEWHGYLRTFTSRLYEVARENAALPSDAAQALIAWQSGTPPVPEGKCWEFIIAVRRAQSKPPGKVAVFSANYANNFTQDGELSDRDGEEFIANGWYVCGLDMSGEYNEVFEPIGLNEGDEIVGWQELPKWSDAAPVAPAAAAPIDTWELIREINGGGALPITASFQQRVQPWMMECFGAEISADRAERNHRFFEEATELVQACGMTASEAHQLVDYTFGRPVGEPHQEVGGVMVTLAALCLANSLDMHVDGETELARIARPDMVIRIRAKQASKPKHSPLPEAPLVISEDRSDSLCDMHYSRGLQAGFTLGQMDDNEGLRKRVESREGYRKVLRETPRAAQLGAPISAAARDVLAERVRQVIEEGRTATHDDRNDLGQMASAAACYAVTHRWTRIDVPPPHWPCDWARAWWKPTTPRRDLVKAGALIIAEIERIDRTEGNAQ